MTFKMTIMVDFICLLAAVKLPGADDRRTAGEL